MSLFLLLLAMVTLIAYLWIAIEISVNRRKIYNLHEYQLSLSQFPHISIVISALNEENSISNTVHKLMQLNYSNFEVIIVNDRSTDNTAHILNTLALQFNNLKVINNADLPAGWLGKNHALHLASEVATGEWLLFMDADVLLEKNALCKAVTYAVNNHIDHLTCLEQQINTSFMLKIVLTSHCCSYWMYLKPWLAKNPRKRNSVGRGAFNLVKKQVYVACGGHKAIRYECLDDVKLGQLIKKKGYRQELANATQLIKICWYSTVRQMISGLSKNVFSFYNYKIIPPIITTALSCIFQLWPIMAIFVCKGLTEVLNILIILITIFIHMHVNKIHRIPILYGVFYPIGLIFVFYTTWHSVYKTLVHGGITWRGTFYPLDTLKELKT